MAVEDEVITTEGTVPERVKGTNSLEAEILKVDNGTEVRSNTEENSDVEAASRNSLMQKYSNRWITQLYEKNFDEYVSVKKWAVEFQKINGEKPSVAQAAAYFKVPTATMSVIRNRESLNNYFRVVSSQKEVSLENFLAENIPDVVYTRNDEDAVPGYSLEFFFPEHNFAVEIAPTLTHHSGDFKNDLLRGVYNDEDLKAPDYHVNKAVAAEEAGVELFTIFDWMPWGKSLDMIRYKLSGSSRKVYARKTEAFFIDKYVSKNKKIAREVKDFIDGIHILGFDGRGSQFFTYLEIDGEIVGAAAWGKPRNLSIKNLRKERGTDIIELTRMCFKPGVSVPGGASKLLKTFMKSYPEKLNSLITFSDYDLGFGNVYGTIGFEMIEKPSPQRNYVHPILVKGEGDNELNFRIKSSSLHFAGSDRLLKNVPGYVAVGMECQHTDVYHPNGACLPSNPQIVESYGFLPVYDCGYKKWRRMITPEEQELNREAREAKIAAETETTLF